MWVAVLFNSIYYSVLFFYFEKAFHTVWRDDLRYNMVLNTINGHIYQVIFNMCQNIKSCLFYNGNKSEYCSC